jgi:predicted phage terminase large subunit-like protein
MSHNSNCSCSLDEPRIVLGVMLRLLVHCARIDPNVFIQLCFSDPSGQPIRQGKVHRELQAFLSAHRQALIELPRDHGKTTQVCARVLWELGRQPALRIKIVCASEALAAERGRFLRDAVANNMWLKVVFPHLKPSQPWSAVRFSVCRPADVIGPSVTAIGVGAASTGARADLLVCDDIVNVRSLRSAAERERVSQFFTNNLMNLLEPDGRFWGLFTPWHRRDLNESLKRNAAYAHFRRPVGDNCEPVWPERWPRRRLEERRQSIGPVSFARGYRLLPVAEEEAPIRPEWVQFWTSDPDAAPTRTVLAVDPAVSTNKRADRSALVTLALGPGNQVRCLEAIAQRVSMSDLVHLINEADRRWRPEVILFESNGAFGGLREMLVRNEGFGPKVKEVKQSSHKGARVDAFSTYVRNGSFQLKGRDGLTVDPSQQELFDEMISFPSGEHDDLVDAAAMGAAELVNEREPKVHVL